MDTLLHSETPVEYFKEVVEKVMARQNFRSSELSSYYLVKLLDNFVALDQCEAGPRATLAELYCEALQSHGRERFAKLKLTGDVALFVSGFFADSIVRRRVELDYYMRMGGTAYGRAAQISPRDSAAMFAELSTASCAAAWSSTTICAWEVRLMGAPHRSALAIPRRCSQSSPRSFAASWTF